MANVKMIDVFVKTVSWWSHFLRNVSFWTVLVAAEWGAHAAFGGSWVVDVLVLMVALIGFVLTFSPHIVLRVPSEV